MEEKLSFFHEKKSPMINLSLSVCKASWVWCLRLSLVRVPAGFGVNLLHVTTRNGVVKACTFQKKKRNDAFHQIEFELR
jgi:hypothetical protein